MTRYYHGVGQGGATFKLSKGNSTNREGKTIPSLREDGTLLIDLLSHTKGRVAALWFDKEATEQIRRLLLEASKT